MFMKERGHSIVQLVNTVFHEVHEGKYGPFQLLNGHALCVYIPEVPVDNDDCDEDGDRVHYECE